MNVIEWFFGYEAIEFYGMPCCVLGFCIMCLLCVCLLGIVLGSVYAITADIIKRITRKRKPKMKMEGRTNDTIKQFEVKARKETAENILNELVKNCQYTFSIDGKPIVELDGDFVLNAAKSYGIKIKE